MDSQKIKAVSFLLDDFDDVCETIHECPAVDEEDKALGFWTKDEVSADRSVRMNQAEAIKALASSDYRGYEHKWCRVVLSSRKRVICQIFAT